MKPILDVCCGSKMFYFDKSNPNVVFMDCRELEDTLCDGRKLKIKPDVIGDFRNIPFPDSTFHLVVFDPPHLIKVGDNSWLAKKYGKLTDTWPSDIKRGFSECMRVLKPYGTLIFKWNEQQIRLSEILKNIDYKPVFGNKRANTHWLVFMKGGGVHKIVEKKILPKYFDAVIHDKKKFEICKDEDDLRIGDAVILKEWNGEKYTGREVGRNIVYILRDAPEYGLMPGYVIFGW